MLTVFQFLDMIENKVFIYESQTVFQVWTVRFFNPYSSSGVTKGPADPAVRGGAILGGRQIVVWIWDNFENLTKVLAKLRILL